MNNEFNIMERINLLIKRWWIMAIGAVLAGSIVYIYTVYFISPTYISKGMIYVNNINNQLSDNVKNDKNTGKNLNDLVASQRLATTYIEILKSDTYMKIVTQLSGVNITPARLRSKISIESKNQTEILEISVIDTDPQNAALIVQSILESSKEEIVRVIKGGSVEIVDNASMPTSPAGPNSLKNTLIGIIIGVILGAIIIFVIDLIDNRVKGQDDITEKYQYPVLGLIPSFRNSRELGYGIPPDAVQEEYYV